MVARTEYLHRNEYYPKHYKQATKLQIKPLIPKIIISQDNQLPLGNTFWPEISVTWFQQRAEFTPCPRDTAQPTRWVSTIKSLPHCSTHYHFTGFTFPKLHFQLFPILKHSSLVPSPRSPSSTKWVHIAEEKKKRVADLHYLECQGHTLHQWGASPVLGSSAVPPSVLLKHFAVQEKNLCLDSTHFHHIKRLHCAHSVQNKTSASLDWGVLGILPHKHRLHRSTGLYKVAWCSWTASPAVFAYWYGTRAMSGTHMINSIDVDSCIHKDPGYLLIAM